MYLIVILSCLNLLERSDFVNVYSNLFQLFISITIWILFIKGHNADVLGYLKILTNTIVVTIFYDFIWLTWHYTTYIHGTSYDHSELAIKRLTYLFSFLLIIDKIFLSISLYIQYYKAVNAKKNYSLTNFNSSSSSNPFNKV